MAGSGTAHLREPSEALIRVEDLVVRFRGTRNRYVQAVSGISLDVVGGETVGLVGESGCGKSTTGRAIVQLPAPTSGKVVYDGVDLTTLDAKRVRRLRPELQLIYQDPISSLDPHMTVEQIVGEPLDIWKKGTKESRRELVASTLEAVGLDPAVTMGKRAREFSGGQCQRICIARALILEPKALILDEPVSALDVSVQAQILNLLEDMKDRYGLTMIFIAHDLAVVRNASDRIIVMYLGKVCEVATTEALFADPAHPYTDGLLASIPQMAASTNGDGDHHRTLSGELPSPLDPPSGCRFRTRCPRAEERCAAEEPLLRAVVGGSAGSGAADGAEHFVACHFPLVEAGAVPAAGSGAAEPGEEG
jgi:peptide/nickel transport system ATP-binding protein